MKQKMLQKKEISGRWGEIARTITYEESYESSFVSDLLS